MSGGVDSSVAAAILKEQGYQVFGITMLLWNQNTPGAINLESACVQDHSEDAKKVCDYLGIEHFVVEMYEEFDKSIIEPFYQSYLNSVTPNPCVECNALMKWGALWNEAKKRGADAIATGHYAFIEEYSDGRNYLIRGDDPKKDQSYFLWRISPQLLDKTYFPIKDLTKDQVRAKAEKLGIVVAQKKESQDICFIPDNDKDRFLKERLDIDKTELISGSIKTVDGKEVGQHKGLMYYTIGQRKGLGIALGEPAFVVKLDVENNTLVVGSKSDLWRDNFECDYINWFAPDYDTSGKKIIVQVRYHSKEIPCSIEFNEDKTVAKVFLSEAVLSVTPGQSAVFYQDNRVIGGGKIKS